MNFLLEKGEATFTEIFTGLGRPRSSTYKTISTLESLGYIRSVGGGMRYCLGIKLLELGARAGAQFDLITDARPLVKNSRWISRGPATWAPWKAMKLSML